MKQLSDKSYVGPQLTAEGISGTKAQGFAAIINNRPDGEEPSQPNAAENHSVAESAQLADTHIPVTAGADRRKPGSGVSGGSFPSGRPGA